MTAVELLDVRITEEEFDEQIKQNLTQVLVQSTTVPVVTVKHPLFVTVLCVVRLPLRTCYK